MDKKLTETELQEIWGLFEADESELGKFVRLYELDKTAKKLKSHIEQLEKSNKFKDKRWEQDLHAKWEWADVAYDWRVKFENAWKENKQQAQEIERLKGTKEYFKELAKLNIDKFFEQKAKAQRLEEALENMLMLAYDTHLPIKFTGELKRIYEKAIQNKEVRGE
jgi:hypothetical protein